MPWSDVTTTSVFAASPAGFRACEQFDRHANRTAPLRSRSRACRGGPCRCPASRRARGRCRWLLARREAGVGLVRRDADSCCRTSRRTARRGSSAFRNCANFSPGAPPPRSPDKPKSRFFPSASSAVPGPQTLPALPLWIPFFASASLNVPNFGGKKILVIGGVFSSATGYAR